MLATGGRDPNGDVVSSSELQCDGSWQPVQQSMASPRYEHGSATLNGLAYVVGGCFQDGCVSNSYLKTMEVYDPSGNGGNGA